MTGCVATVNIGRTFGSDDAAQDWGFDAIGGIDHVDTFSIARNGDVMLKVRP